MHTSRLKLLQIMPYLLHGIVFVYSKNNMAAKLNPHMVNLKTMALLLPFYFLPGKTYTNCKQCHFVRDK